MFPIGGAIVIIVVYIFQFYALVNLTVAHNMTHNLAMFYWMPYQDILLNTLYSSRASGL